MNLNEMKCEACQAGAPKVSDEELAQLMKELPDWVPVSVDGVLQLQREYKFKNFREALAFTNKVGELAESEGHHPDIYLAWGKVRLTLWTHKIDGLSESDFIFAAKVGTLA